MIALYFTLGLVSAGIAVLLVDQFLGRQTGPALAAARATRSPHRTHGHRSAAPTDGAPKPPAGTGPAPHY